MDSLAQGGQAAAGPGEPLVHLGRGSFELPARDLLPPLERYAHLAIDARSASSAPSRASHGCVHRSPEASRDSEECPRP